MTKICYNFIVNNIKELLAKPDLPALTLYLAQTHPYDLKDDFFDLSIEEIQTIIPLIEKDKLGTIFSNNPSLTNEILLLLPLNIRHNILINIEPDDLAEILSSGDDHANEELSKSLDPEVREDVNDILGSEKDSVGSHMNTNYLAIPQNLDVKEATRTVINHAKDAETINTIFVTDENNLYLGSFSLNKLLRARSPLLVSEILVPGKTTTIDTNIERTIEDFKNYEVNEMAVLDHTGQLCGILTIDDVIDITIDEQEEDVLHLAGLPTTKKSKGVLSQALHRLPWLILFLALSLLVALVTGGFEATLALVPILMIFEPLILDAGGDVGTQTLGIILTLLNRESTKLKENVYKELLTGILNGIIEGLIAFGVTYFFVKIAGFEVDPLLMAWIVGLSLFGTVVVSPLIAIIIPLTIKLFKGDPAIASGPFITTIIDIASLLIFFVLATVFLGVK